jgi:hypothetical protein
MKIKLESFFYRHPKMMETAREKIKRDFKKDPSLFYEITRKNRKTKYSDYVHAIVNVDSVKI